MQVAELKKEGLNTYYKVVIPAQKVSNAIQKELDKLSKTIRIDGFRIGKVPMHILQKKYGDSVKLDAINHEINHQISHIVKDNNLDVASSPEITDKVNITDTTKDLEFTVKFELMPKVDLPSFDGVTLEKPVLEVEDQDLQHRIDHLAEMFTEYNKESKGKAAKGDQVTIDAVGYVDGEPFEGGKLDAHKLVLGSHSFIDTFEDQLIGSKAGDEVTVKVTFPKQYHAENLAGKPSEFKVKVLSVHKGEKPEINDEFAKKLKADTLEKLKENLKKEIEAEFDEPIRTIMKMRLFDQLEAKLNFDIPESMLTKERSVLEHQVKELSDNDQSLKKKSKQELEEFFNKVSLRRVRIGLMLAEYVRANEIQITNQDIQKAVIAQARNFPSQEMAVVEYYQKNPKALRNLEGPILEEKAVDHIFENLVKIKEKKYTRKKLEKFLEEQNNEMDII